MSGSLQPAVSKDHHQRALVEPLAKLLLEPGGQQEQRGPAEGGEHEGGPVSAAWLSGLSAAQLLALQCSLVVGSGQDQCLEAGPLLFQPVADGELLLPPTVHEDGGTANTTNKLDVLEQQLQTTPAAAGGVVPLVVGYCRDEDVLFRLLCPPHHFQCSSQDQFQRKVRGPTTA